MQVKISIHCGQVNTFLIQEFESRAQALSFVMDKIRSTQEGDMLQFGELLVNPALVTFVTTDEVVLQENQPSLEEANVEVV